MHNTTTFTPHLQIKFTSLKTTTNSLRQFTVTINYWYCVCSCNFAFSPSFPLPCQHYMFVANTHTHPCWLSPILDSFHLVSCKGTHSNYWVAPLYSHTGLSASSHTISLCTGPTCTQPTCTLRHEAVKKS